MLTMEMGEDFYPGHKKGLDGNFYGSEQQVGDGAGKGFNVNIPLPCDGLGDYHVVIAFENVVIPILEKFKPDLILISAGFDSAHGDPIGRLDVTKKGYEYMTSQLMQFTDTVLALEGGYNVKNIPKLFQACAEILVSDKNISGKELKHKYAKTLDHGNKRKREETELFMESLTRLIEHPVLKFWNLTPEEPNLSEELRKKLKLSGDETMDTNELHHAKHDFVEEPKEKKKKDMLRFVGSFLNPYTSQKMRETSKQWSDVKIYENIFPDESEVVVFRIVDTFGPREILWETDMCEFLIKKEAEQISTDRFRFRFGNHRTCSHSVSQTMEDRFKK